MSLEDAIWARQSGFKRLSRPVAIPTVFECDNCCSWMEQNYCSWCEENYEGRIKPELCVVESLTIWYIKWED